MTRVAFGGIHTECSTYSTLRADHDDFVVTGGSDLAPSLGLDWAETTAIPLFHARAIPGGMVKADTYQAFKVDFLAQLATALPLDGVLLVMHGAMVVEGLVDAEADWIEAVRAIVGESCIIAASYDLHGNVSARVIDALDIFAAYRTAPHVDVHETHRRAQTMLLAALATGQRPGIAYVPIPLLWPGERTSTVDEPARSMFAALPAYESDSGIQDANLMVGYVWADESRATASAIVCGTSAEACARAAREIGQNYWDNRRNFAFGMPTGPLEAMLDLSSDGSGPVILADSGDNPTGGGVGDRPDVLRALLQRDRTEALVAGIADAPAARAAAKAGIGEICRLAIGYSLDPVGTPLQVTAHIEHILGETGGLEVLIRISKTRVILTERRRPFHNLVDFRRFGIDPAAIRLLVVKSGYLSPELALLAKPALMALTPGAVNQDILQLTNNFRPRRTYPFNWDVDWAPKAHLSKRWRILA